MSGSCAAASSVAIAASIGRGSACSSPLLVAWHDTSRRATSREVAMLLYVVDMLVRFMFYLVVF